MNDSRKLTIALSLICILFIIVLIIKSNKIDSLRQTLASTALERTEIYHARIKTSRPSNQTTAMPRKPSNSADIQERRLKSQNIAEANQLDERVKQITDYRYEEQTPLTMEQLQEKHPEVFKRFSESIDFDLECCRKYHEKRMALLESLNPNFLSEDKFKFLQEKLKERIAEDECDIAFKRRPLPEGGRYDKYGNIWMSGSVSPTTLPHISNIIEEYCANANGLNDADALKTIGQLDMAMHLGGFVILKPIIKK